MKDAFILAELLMYSLSVVCRVLSVTQSGFHAWWARVQSPRDLARDRLRIDIRKVFDIHRGRDGAPRLYRILREQHGYSGSLNRIKALMKQRKHLLTGLSSKKFESKIASPRV